MSKKRRTKKQKLAAATRHDFSTVLTLNHNEQSQTKINIELPKVEENQQPVQTRAAYTRSHAYVIHDVRSTITITAALLLANILIHTLLTHKIISIPGIGF